MGPRRDKDIAALAQFLRIDADERAALAAGRVALETALPHAVDLLYDDMRGHAPALGKFVDEPHLQRARAGQLNHWGWLVAGELGAAHAERAKRIGEAHARIGLDHGFYIGGYALVLAELVRALLRDAAIAADVRARTVTALLKCAMLDISIVLSAYLDAADAESTARARFFAGLGDDLRTPLNVIIGYAELLLEEIPPQLSSADDLNHVIRSGERLRNLINGLLEVARVQTDSAAGCDAIDLAVVVGAAVEILREEAASRRVNIKVSGSPPPVFTDSEKLGRCLHILLRNAARFTVDGDVEVRMSYTRGLGEDVVTFEVRDTGIGLSGAQLARLFGDGAMTEMRDRGGPGFGLMVARTLARQLNGELSARSELGKGSVFTLPIHCPLQERA